MKRLSEAFAPEPFPPALAELYAVAEGEVSQGLFVPGLAFLPAAAVAQLVVAIRSLEGLNVDSAILDRGVPFFRDMVNHLMLYVDELTPKGGVYYVDADELSVWRVSPTLSGFLERLVLMHEANDAAGRAVCPGDYRCLSDVEQRIVGEVEGQRKQ